MEINTFLNKEAIPTLARVCRYQALLDAFGEEKIAKLAGTLVQCSLLISSPGYMKKHLPILEQIARRLASSINEHQSIRGENFIEGFMEGVKLRVNVSDHSANVDLGVLSKKLKDYQETLALLYPQLQEGVDPKPLYEAIDQLRASASAVLKGTDFSDCIFELKDNFARLGGQ